MADSKNGSGFSVEEKAAMKERALELKASAKREDGEKVLLASFEKLSGLDRELAERVHVLVAAAAPELAPKTYYGMPAWALDDKTVVFFKPSGKFKERYSTLGFEQAANIDDGTMWPSSYAIIAALTPAQEMTITELVKKAVS
jgi:uncharacterized protein YdhG (YjbR/CyaY superfamily)